MDIITQFEKVYENCRTHMTDTIEDWEKAFNALRGIARRAGDRPEHIRTALLYYDMLEVQISGKVERRLLWKLVKLNARKLSECISNRA